MSTPKHVFVYMTVPDDAVADTIAEALVDGRLAACVNILPPMRSYYRWNETIERATEIIVIAKTRAALMEELTARVRALHPFDTPCVVALPLAERLGATDFLDWIADETAGEDRT